MQPRLFFAIMLTSITTSACSLYAGNPPDPARVAANLPDDFADHTERVEGGRVDWTNGYILADGIGHPNGGESSDGQRRKMAMRAAELVAARNALAMAQGVRLDASRKVADVANGLVHVEGVVRGHRIVESRWHPDEKPPTAHVVLQVPLWGVRGVASVFVQSERGAAQQTAVGRRLVLSPLVADVTDIVVVIDARGRKVSPCLFPVVVDAEGRTLYDVGTLSPETASLGPTVGYVETKLSFERLQSAVDSRFVPVWFDTLVQDSPGGADAKRVPATSPMRDPSSDTQPARRRAKQRIVVKATDATGAQKPHLVITREDAERLRNSPEASGALRKAQVLVVVDASAAGTEGRAPFEADGALAIAATEP